MFKRYLIVVCVLLFSTVLAYGQGWNAFRGSDRTGISSETGLLTQWPEGGPKELWAVDGLGIGYSSAAIADDMVYTTGLDEKSNNGFLFAFDTKGKLQWKKDYGPEWRGSFKGARTTPTIDEGNIYIISGYAVVKCFDAKTGQEKWSYDAGKEFKSRRMTWGIAESPLIYKNMVICSPCGDDAAMIALDKKTGKLIWACAEIKETAGYCSPIVAEHNGRNIIINILQISVIGIDADTGKLLFKAETPEPSVRYGRDNNPNSPIYHDGHFFINSGYGKGAALYKIADDGQSAEQVWHNRTMDTHHGGAVLIDGYVYGTSWDGNDAGTWVCMEFKTGKVMYDEKWLGFKGSIIAADGMLYCWEEKQGNIALVKANPEKFEIVSSFKVEKGDREYWAHPSISDGILYLRHGDMMMAYDIKKKQ